MFEKELTQFTNELSNAKDKWLKVALNKQGIILSESPTIEEFKEYKSRIELQINRNIDPKCENLYVDDELVGKWYEGEIVYGDNSISFTNKFWIKNE